MKISLIIPPFIQPNTAYPSLQQLAGYLNKKGYDVQSLDLSVKTILKIFSKEGLTEVFEEAGKINEPDFYSERMLKLADVYIETIEPVIKFLQGRDNNFAYSILREGYLPVGASFEQLNNEEITFGNLGITDKAKYYGSLYLQDIIKFIQQNISPQFGFSRYAESISSSQPDFGEIEKYVVQDNLINRFITDTIEEYPELTESEFIGLSVPFPGNLVGALITAKQIKKYNPDVKIILGGGYINTELRDITDTGIFNYVDYITYDDGEIPIERILEGGEFVRTKVLEEGRIITFSESENTTIFEPNNYTNGINPADYLSIIEIPNPMHKLWSDGYWNKLTVAHGCYWKKCTFCDVNLDYIGRYSPGKAKHLVDEIESLIKQTGRTSFHFTDEAAPPALLGELALEIISRNLNITWWGNIRFEKAFTKDLCALLARSGCIAVTGGIEVANERLLILINKGVTVAQAAQTCANFTDSGVMVHAYLMYGFPSQTAQETIDSLEIVRQFFEAGILQSAFWHKFILTRHSPVYEHLGEYPINIKNDSFASFANNDLVHTEHTGHDHERYSYGLKKSLYNYMNAVCLDWDVRQWFDFKMPKSKILKNYVSGILEPNHKNVKKFKKIVWLGSKLSIVKNTKNQYILSVHSNSFEADFNIPVKHYSWFNNLVNELLNRNRYITLKEACNGFSGSEQELVNFLSSSYFEELRGNILLLI